MPPAATSHQDIYHPTASASLSSAPSSAYHHLPDYMMFLDTKQQSSTHQSPSNVDKATRNATSTTSTTPNIVGASDKKQPVNGNAITVTDNHKFEQTKPTSRALIRRQSSSQCCWHKLQEQESFSHYDTYLMPSNMFNKSQEELLFKTTRCGGSSQSCASKQLMSSRQKKALFPNNSASLDHYQIKDDYCDDRIECDTYDRLDPLMLVYDHLSASSTPSDIHLISDDHHQPSINSCHLSQQATSQQATKQQQSTSSGLQMGQQYQQYLTIEELKLTLNSCWLCGCNWQEDHVSLDCSECGGYAMTRPCPSCDGKCRQIWTRNITGTHDRHIATWTGQCLLQQAAKAASEDNHAATTKDRGSSSLLLPSSSSCCSSQPSSATSSDSEELDESLEK